MHGPLNVKFPVVIFSALKYKAYTPTQVFGKAMGSGKLYWSHKVMNMQQVQSLFVSVVKS